MDGFPYQNAPQTTSRNYPPAISFVFLTFTSSVCYSRQNYISDQGRRVICFAESVQLLGISQSPRLRFSTVSDMRETLLQHYSFPTALDTEHSHQTDYIILENVTASSLKEIDDDIEHKLDGCGPFRVHHHSTSTNILVLKMAPGSLLPRLPQQIWVKSSNPLVRHVWLPLSQLPRHLTAIALLERSRTHPSGPLASGGAIIASLRSLLWSAIVPPQKH